VKSSGSSKSESPTGHHRPKMISTGRKIRRRNRDREKVMLCVSRLASLVDWRVFDWAILFYGPVVEEYFMRRRDLTMPCAVIIPNHAPATNFPRVLTEHIGNDLYRRSRQRTGAHTALPSRNLRARSVSWLVTCRYQLRFLDVGIPVEVGNTVRLCLSTHSNTVGCLWVA
jgi:hypothetical protein